MKHTYDQTSYRIFRCFFFLEKVNSTKQLGVDYDDKLK